jgi:serine/threonine-protein kinase
VGDMIIGNRYEVIKKIADGGMAFVYLAKDKLLNRTVAVKVLRPEFVDDEEFLAKFKREAEAVASLSHPNIVNVYDVGEDRKIHYIVMEYVDGQNLKDIIKNEGTLDEYTALDITKQIAMALSAAHKKGIIHRDIKPHNILISNEGRVVKVADFGIAKAVSNSTMTNIGSIIGSVHYFSPEQAKGKFVSNNADLYSLGIVLYEMLLGKVPFRGDSPIAIALQHINDEIEFTSEEKVKIPQSVRTIIKKLTEKSTADRYQSAEELIEDIEYIEKNIDLDFIKEYDNFATQKIDNEEIKKSLKQIKTLEEKIEEEEEVVARKDKKRKKAKKPENRKALTIAAIVLGIVLCMQLIIGAKFLFGSSATQTTLPDFYNESLDDVQKTLDKLKLKIIIRDEYNSEIEKDYVVDQTPVAGTVVKKGDTVTIIVSKGAKRAEVPNIVGISLEEAENLLKDNKLSLGKVTYEYNDIYKKGIVLEQDPTYGSNSAEEGDKINVVVSKGQEVEETPIEEVVETPSTQQPTTTQTPQTPVVTPEPTPEPDNSEPSDSESDTSESDNENSEVEVIESTT